MSKRFIVVTTKCLKLKIEYFAVGLSVCLSFFSLVSNFSLFVHWLSLLCIWIYERKYCIKQIRYRLLCVDWVESMFSNQNVFHKILPFEIVQSEKSNETRVQKHKWNLPVYFCYLFFLSRTFFDCFISQCWHSQIRWRNEEDVTRKHWTETVTHWHRTTRI